MSNCNCNEMFCFFAKSFWLTNHTKPYNHSSISLRRAVTTDRKNKTHRMRLQRMDKLNGNQFRECNWFHRPKLPINTCIRCCRWLMRSATIVHIDASAEWEENCYKCSIQSSHHHTNCVHVAPINIKHKKCHSNSITLCHRLAWRGILKAKIAIVFN